MVTYNNRPQISAVERYDQQPVTIYVDTIDSYYPSFNQPHCTILTLRSGVTHDIECDYFVVRGYLTRDELLPHKVLMTKESDAK